MTKLYEVELNSKGMPNFSTAKEVPQRMRGKWIPFDIPWYQCSECGAVRENKSFMENFCPNCGAWMLEEPYKGEQG